MKTVSITAVLLLLTGPLSSLLNCCPVSTEWKSENAVVMAMKMDCGIVALPHVSFFEKSTIDQEFAVQPVFGVIADVIPVTVLGSSSQTTTLRYPPSSQVPLRI